MQSYMYRRDDFAVESLTGLSGSTPVCYNCVCTLHHVVRGNYLNIIYGLGKRSSSDDLIL